MAAEILPAIRPELLLRWRRLLARIRRRYQTTTERIALGRIELVFTRIAEPDRVLDEVAEEEDRRDRAAGRPRREDELHLPYWAELWESSRGVAQFLVEEARPPAGRRHALAGVQALDLGCGMGLAGTAAAALGARVVFADIETPALLFAALNSLPYRPRTRTQRLNWRTDTLGRRFVLVLGADILYERSQWEHLDRFWRNHLADGGRIVLGEPGRQTGDAFPAWASALGWRLSARELRVAGRARAIRIFELRA